MLVTSRPPLDEPTTLERPPGRSRPNGRQEKGKKRREIEKRMDMLRQELGDRAYKQLEAEMEGDWDEEVFDRAMDKILAGDIGDVSWARFVGVT
jgi:hypothetical protein